MVNLPTRVLWYGSNEPLAEQRSLRAGPFTMLLEHGTLRSIKFGLREVVRGIYAAVRDKNWNTIEPRFLSYEVEAQDNSFEVRFTAEHTNAEVDFVWQGTILGSSDGTLQFTFDGQARRSFLKNRVGFCILHPMELAGLPVEVDTPDGTISGTFPQRISPHQPFKDIQSLRFSVSPQVTLEMRFQGELFEMEDQRNWTDASYKTYCTPLRLPYPVDLQQGERILQTITLRPLGPVSAADLAATSVPEPRLVLGKPITHLPPLGLGTASHHVPLTETELRYLQPLHLNHLWAEIDLHAANWQSLLLQASAEAQALSAELELSLLCDDAGELLAPFVDALSRQPIPIARLFLFPLTTFVTTEALLSRASTLLSAAGLSIPLGGGSRANFTELNRAILPLPLMDLAGYALNPQVHAFDNTSLVETLAAQGETVKNARTLVGSLPLSIGPVTLKPRFNAAATASEDDLAPGELPATVDVRQMSLFAAGWTLSSIRHLASAGAHWLTYYETTGWRGLMERPAGTQPPPPFPFLPGVVFPIYHVFADLAEFPATELLSLEISDQPSLEALALRKSGRLLLLLANLIAEPQSVTISAPALHGVRLRILDETTAEDASFNAEAFRQNAWQPLEDVQGELRLNLRPFAFVRLDASLKDE